MIKEQTGGRGKKQKAGLLRGKATSAGQSMGPAWENILLAGPKK